MGKVRTPDVSTPYHHLVAAPKAEMRTSHAGHPLYAPSHTAGRMLPGIELP